MADTKKKATTKKAAVKKTTKTPVVQKTAHKVEPKVENRYVVTTKVVDTVRGTTTVTREFKDKV